MKEWRQLSVAEVLRNAEDDWIPIDNVIAYGWEEGTRANEDPKETTVELLRFLLDQDLMLIGDLGDSGFEGWACSVEESVKAFGESPALCRLTRFMSQISAGGVGGRN